MKLETHCHTFGTSSCADTKNEIIIEKYLKAGYGGIVATNHFSVHAYNGYFPGATHKEKVDSFFAFIDEFSAMCKEVNIKAFWGVEVRTPFPKEVSGTEFMVYGLDKKYFYDKPLFLYSQQELFELCEKTGAFMYQTHPFRRGVVAGDPNFMHGAEAFNGHYHHPNNNEIAQKFCKENSLIEMSGTDFHHVDQPITAGIIIPDDVKDESKLVQIIKNREYTSIRDEQTYIEEYTRYRNSR